ncbi:MAG: glycosyltransferase family 4 protein [Halothece sp.]
MNILLTVHHHLDPNAGAPGVTLKLGQEYQKMGHQVYYYGFDNLPGYFSGKLKSVVFPEYLACYLLKVWFGKNQIDVIDASTGDSWLWGTLTRWYGTNRPLLVTRSHGLEHTFHHAFLEQAQKGNHPLSWKYPLYHGGFRLWEVASSLRRADLTFLLNQEELDYAVVQLKIPREKTCVVANGVSESFLSLPFEPKAKSSTIRIAQVGSYISRKGIHYGVPALNVVLRRYPHVQVSFLGTGCSQATVHQDFDETVRDRVQVIPHYTHDSLPTLLQGHQIKLLPSLFEGLPLVLLEAMACGLTPITTSLAGAKEIITDGDNGLLVPPYDSQAIISAIAQLIINPSYLEQLRRKAYATAQDYSWSCIARHNLTFYQQGLDQLREKSQQANL